MVNSSNLQLTIKREQKYQFKIFKNLTMAYIKLSLPKI